MRKPLTDKILLIANIPTHKIMKLMII